MSAGAGNPCLSGREALAYAYQGVLLRELALMRGLQTSIITLLRPNPGSVGRPIVSAPGIPRGRGAVHDPEVTLSRDEVFDGIAHGIRKCLSDKGMGRGARVSRSDVKRIFDELVGKGWLVPIPDVKPDGKQKKQSRVYIRFKTLHGELLRLASSAAPLPDRYETSGFLVLPAVLEPIAGPAGRRGLPPAAKEWMRRQCPSSDLADAIIDIVEESLENAGYKELNTYQYSVVQEYFRRRLGGGRVDAVLAAPTGGGKTLAFTVIVLLEVLAAKCRGERRPAVLVYPRKTLAREQVESLARIIYSFNSRAGAPSGVPPTIRLVVWLRDGNSGTAKCGSQEGCVELPRSWDSIRGITVGGVQAMHRYSDARGLYESRPEWLIDARDNVDVSPLGAGRMKPYEAADIVVTNYDMVFKAVIERLSGRRGSAEGLWEALRGSSVIVLDEAHMVLGSERVIATQTLALALRLAGARPGFIVSSATLLSRRIYDPATATQNYVAVELLSGPSRDEASEAFTSLLGLEPSQLVYVDYYSEASKGPRGWKMTLWATIYPSLLRKPTTALNEAIVSALHLAAGKRGHDPQCRLRTIVFIEYKSSLHDIVEQLVNRIILESGDVYDRVILLESFDNHARSLGKWLSTALGQAAGSPAGAGHREAKKVIGGMINGSVRNKGSMPVLSLLWDPSSGLRRFHALSPYTTPRDYSSRGLLSTPVTGRGKPPLAQVEDIVRRIVERAAAAFPSPPLHGRLWMEHLLVHAALMSFHGSWKEGPDLKAYYDDIVRLGLDRFVPIAVHHGDYTGKYRHIADILLQKDPLTIIATSTLEVGLNIPCVAATLHYILPKQPGRILQMVGRSGREPETMRVSLGIAFLRPNAWETPKRLESRANRYFHEVEAPPSPSIARSPYNLARLCITSGLRCHDISPALSRATHAILETAERIVEERQNVLSEIHKVLSSRTVPTLSRICEPSTLQKLRSYASRASHNTRLREALDSLHRACSYSGNQNHALALAAAEWAYSEAVEAFQKAIDANRQTRWLDDLIDLLSRLRARLYAISIHSLSPLLQKSPADTAGELVYPRPYTVGAGEQQSPAGQVVIVG